MSSGGRGRRFESSHSDQITRPLRGSLLFLATGTPEAAYNPRLAPPRAEVFPLRSRWRAGCAVHDIAKRQSTGQSGRHGGIAWGLKRVERPPERAQGRLGGVGAIPCSLGVREAWRPRHLSPCRRTKRTSQQTAPARLGGPAQVRRRFRPHRWVLNSRPGYSRRRYHHRRYRRYGPYGPRPRSCGPCRCRRRRMCSPTG